MSSESLALPGVALTRILGRFAGSIFVNVKARELVKSPYLFCDAISAVYLNVIRRQSCYTGHSTIILKS